MHKLSAPTKILKSRFSPAIRTLSTEDDQLWFKPQIGLETGISVYNTVAKRKVPVILPNKNYVSWYTCGPTVYDSTHLGHASCYVKIDIIQRLLRNHFQMNLVTAMNITDIDDKIIKRSQETGVDWRELARQYEAEFWTDMEKLGVAQPNIKLRVTEHMPLIIEFIKKIKANGFAYVGKDQSVYFDTRKFPIYGKLQKINFDEKEAANEDNLGKSNAADFALWKARTNSNEPSFDSPWGSGRPGWHIECSTLASLIFGQSIDFHAGGLDLRFPHHENEEAQCCVFHNTKQWINYWLHTGQLNLKGQSMKMSKSLKNTISVGEILKNYSADEFRMACAMSNYRNSVEYSSELMETARNTLNRFKSFHRDCQAYLSGLKRTSVPLDANSILKNLTYAKSQLDASFKDDFDTARALSVLMEQISNLSRIINTSDVSNAMNSSCLDCVAAVDNFVAQSMGNMGFSTSQLVTNAGMVQMEDEINLNLLLEDLLFSRKAIRERAMSMKSKELFEICDELRKVLLQHGVDVRDHNLGSSWSFIKKKMA